MSTKRKTNQHQDTNLAKFSSSAENGTKVYGSGLDFALYGILWEQYISKNAEQHQSLLDYYNVEFNEIFFSKKMDFPLDLETIYQKEAIQAIEYELHKKFMIFDGYIPSKKIILEMKLSTFGAIGLKDIAYLYYFKDYQLHFLFFIPSKNTASINKMFVKRIKQLVKNYNRFLISGVSKLDLKDVLARVKLITRHDLPNFPDLSEEFSILERILYSPPYICNICPNKEFTDHYALVDHIHSKYDPQKIPCPECDEFFASKRERLDHLREDHGGKQICDICGKENQNKKALAQHMYQSHNQRECEECGKVYKSPKALLKHRGRMHKNNKFPCNECDKVFSILFDLTKHKSAFHSGEQICDFCGKKYKNKQYLYQHKSGVHSGEQTCDICGTLCKSKYALSKHKKRQH